MESPPPNHFEEFFGFPPHLRFLDSYYEGSTDEEVLFEARKTAPHSSTPEQTYHDVMSSLRLKGSRSVPSVLDRLYKIWNEDGPFDGILGNSEGAIVAATFVADYLKRCAETQTQPELKCAVFMGGGPPYTSDGAGLLLADQCGQIINIPTCHILAFNDPLIHGCLALYHLCDEKDATLVEHGRGHMVPRDARLSKIMIKGIRDLIKRAETPQMGQ